ncbi:PHP domain-containing protein [endosymbiont of Lamellibrachia barhami]|uniref:PHP domain-containing protein n=1 Tax=endosymbiont of Lamellibrachia barhami TaxID=205975 RepID=UPI0015AA3E4B|nr:PHP domain-containing protein [endosymbiont of Lamellibrachia barhami]
MFCEYDLHNHSTASDGTLAPANLVQMAADAGVRVLALTDHDSTEGVAEAVKAAARLDIHLIAGAEISVTWQRQTVHIVALNLDTDCGVLQEGLKGLRQRRDRRAEEISLRLEKSGIPDALEGARSFSNGRLISRTHFARYLAKIGAASDERAVFKHFLVNGKPGHVAGQWASLGEAVGWIREAGGQAVVAHPARYRMTRTKLRRLLADFVEVGGVGLEVVSGSHSKDEAFTMARHAADFALLASAGSDFHTPDNPWIALGRLPLLPDGCVPVWRDWGLALENPITSNVSLTDERYGAVFSDTPR